MNFKKEKLLIIAPHADDEVLGCFGLINKIKKNGGSVFVQVLTLGGYGRVDSIRVKKETWKKEFVKSVKSLEIDGYDIMFYKEKIKHLDEIPLFVLIEYLESKSRISLRKLKPTIVAIPTIFSTHQDHTAAYKACISALRMQPKNILKPAEAVISYESPEYNLWSPYIEFGNFSPNLYLGLSDYDLKRKTSVLNLYKSQLKKRGRDKSTVVRLANLRGAEIGADYAEGYHLHRLIL